MIITRCCSCQQSPLSSGSTQHNKLWVNVRDPSAPLATYHLQLATCRAALARGTAEQSRTETRNLSGRQPKEQAKGSFMNETKAQTKKKTMRCADRDGGRGREEQRKGQQQSRDESTWSAQLGCLWTRSATCKFFCYCYESVCLCVFVCV